MGECQSNQPPKEQEYDLICGGALLHPSLLAQLPSQDKEEERAEDAPDPHPTTFSNTPQGHYIYNNIPRYLSWHLVSTISEQLPQKASVWPVAEKMILKEL
jgi:hypothetical protein